jgi:hypothetical protein
LGRGLCTRERVVQRLAFVARALLHLREFGNDEEAAREALTDAERQWREGRTPVAVGGELFIAGTEIAALHVGEAI